MSVKGRWYMTGVELYILVRTKESEEKWKLKWECKRKDELTTWMGITKYSAEIKKKVKNVEDVTVSYLKMKSWTCRFKLKC